tara:strand:+ start:1306 stop:2052 length:747 start_codon:yes stop_codon:yes gene_type:complete
MKQLTAGIIIIGNEILSGRTKETNSNFIAKELIKIGVKLIKISVIPDEKKEIIKNVICFHKKFDYVFTTGGIGPTHDDITSESVAKAFKKKYRVNAKALKILKDYYPVGKINSGRIKMAKLPVSSELILNPLTGAPGFKLKNVYVLPGVPIIMKKMFKSLLKNLKKNKPKKIITINTNLFESIIAQPLTKIQKKYSDCEIGSYPYFNFSKKKGGVNITISSWKRDDLSIISNEIIKNISLLGGKSFIV